MVSVNKVIQSGLLATFMAAAIVATIAAAQPVSADVIYFTNGDQLQGQLVSMQNGKLVFKADVVGEVTVDMSQVRNFTTDTASEFHFKDGTVVNKVVKAAADLTVSIEDAPLLAGHPVAISELAAINPPAEPEPEWQGQVVVGAKLERGNTIRNDVNLDASVMKEREKDRIKLTFEYDEKRQENAQTGQKSTSKRRYEAEINYDYFLTTHWYLSSLVQLHKETTANLDLRTGVGESLGYRWFKSKQSGLETEAGLGWVQERFSNNSPDQSYTAMRLAWDYFYQLTGNTRFFHETEWLASLENKQDQFADSKTGISTQLNSRLTLDAKVRYRWNQTPAANSDRNDWTYIFGIGWRF